MDMDTHRKTIPVLSVALLVLAAVAGCGGSSTPEPTAPTDETSPKAKTVVTIGNLTDMSGQASAGMNLVTLALHDHARYTNEEGLIPGIELEVIDFDTKLDPSRTVPGYRWLRDNGADIVFTLDPSAPELLKPIVDAEGIPLFVNASTYDELMPPGYLFNLGVVTETEMYTLLKWVADNDWDYQANGPAKVGGAGWPDDVSPQRIAAAEAYCIAHPDQFEWVGGYLTDFSFTWDQQVEALVETDYVLPPVMMTTFIKQYREAGAEGTILGNDAHLLFLEGLDDAGLWEEADGALFMRLSRWWNEEAPIVDATEEVLARYRPEAAAELRRRGVGYLGAGTSHMVMVEGIKRAAEAVGAENLTSQDISNAMESLSVMMDDLEFFSFGPTKRDALNYMAPYELRADGQDLFRVTEEWYPVVRTP